MLTERMKMPDGENMRGAGSTTAINLYKEIDEQHHQKILDPKNKISKYILNA